MDYAVIKVKILSGQGKILYPNFNSLDVVAQSGLDWSQYIDQNGSGWLYDNKCGHAEVDADSPEGEWFGLLLIPEQFAVEAVAAFSDRITRLNETDAEVFYDDRHAVNMPDEDIDTDVLQSIKLKQDLEIELTVNQLKALDPEDDTPGIRKNKKKKWADFKVLKNVAVVAPS